MEVEVKLKRYQLELEELKMEKDGRRYEDQKMLDKTDESVALWVADAASPQIQKELANHHQDKEELKRYQQECG